MTFFDSLKGAKDKFDKLSASISANSGKTANTKSAGSKGVAKTTNSAAVQSFLNSAKSSGTKNNSNKPLFTVEADLALDAVTFSSKPAKKTKPTAKSAESPQKPQYSTAATSDTSVLSASNSHKTKSKKPFFLETVVNKFGLHINADNPDEWSDSDIKGLQQGYTVDYLQQSTEKSKVNMAQYFKTLGAFDKAYDAIKGFFGTGITRNDVEEHAAQEEKKNEVLAKVVKNGGNIDVKSGQSDEHSVSTDEVKELASFTLNNCETVDDMVTYAISALGVEENSALELVLKNSPHINGANDVDCSLTKDDEGNYKVTITSKSTQDEVVDIDDTYVEKEWLTKELVEASKIDDINRLTFEEMYKISTGTDYDTDKINAAIKSAEPYSTVLQIQNAALVDEVMYLTQPPETIYDAYLVQYKELYDQMKDNPDFKDSELAYYTPQELAARTFNEHYEQVMNYNYVDEKTGQTVYPVKDSMVDVDGVSCVGISISDDGRELKQELQMPEDWDNEYISSYCYSKGYYVDKENDRYYQIIDLEGEKNLVGYYPTKTNNGETMYAEKLWAESANMLTYNEHAVLSVQRAEFEKENGKGSFDFALKDYPEKAKEAYGTNALLNKLTNYKADMDTYAQKISQAASIACFAASFIPGVQVGTLAVLGSAAFDNGVDFVNLATNQKDGEIGEWSTNLLKEAATMAVGFKMNGIANKIGYKLTGALAPNSAFVASHARGFEAAAEFATDNAMSIGYDVLKGVANGDMLNEDGSFNWDAFKQTAITDAIFNTADLRAGMALYRSLNAGAAVDIGNGTKLQIDQTDGTIRYIYDNGQVVELKGNSAYDITGGSRTKVEFVDGKWVDINSTSSKTVSEVDSAVAKLQDGARISSIENIENLFPDINENLFGERLDLSLEGATVEVGGKTVQLLFDNDAVTPEYLKNNPTGAQVENYKVIPDGYLLTIYDALEAAAKQGREIPDRIYFTELMGGAGGAFSTSDTNAIFIALSPEASLDKPGSLLHRILHEKLHFEDFLGCSADGEPMLRSDINGEKYGIDISSDINFKYEYNGNVYDCNDFDDIVGIYARSSRQEFIADVGSMIDMGKIKYDEALGRYFLSDEWADTYKGTGMTLNAYHDYNRPVLINDRNNEVLNAVMDAYNKLTGYEHVDYVQRGSIGDQVKYQALSPEKIRAMSDDEIDRISYAEVSQMSDEAKDIYMSRILALENNNPFDI